MKKINKKLIFFLLWFFLISTLLLFHSNYVSNSDEGLILGTAWHLYNNFDLYNEIFVFKSPGSYFFIYWLWLIFGVSYLVAKFFSILFLIFSTIGLYKIGKILNFKILNFLPIFLFAFSSFFWPIVNYYIYSLAFLIWSIYFYLLFIKNYKLKYLFFSSFFSGLTLIFLQNLGIYLIIFNLIFLCYILIKKGGLLQSLATYITMPVLIIFLLLLKWSPELLWYNLIKFPFLNYTDTAKISIAYASLFIIINSIIAYFIYKYKNNKIIYLLLLQLVLLISTFTLADITHISFFLFPLYILCSIIIKNRNLYQIKRKIISYLIIILFFCSLLPIFKLSYNYIKNFPPMYSNLEISPFSKIIKKECNNSEYLFATPFLPNIYFETKKINATKFPFLLTRLHTEKQFIEAKNQLIYNKPVCVITNYQMVKKYNYNLNNPVDNYINEYYSNIANFGDYNILKIIN